MDSKIQVALETVVSHYTGDEHKLGKHLDKVLFVLINYLLTDPNIAQDEDMATAIFFTKELRNCFLNIE